MLLLEVRSFLAVPDDVLEPVGWAIDGDPAFRLVRAGPRDPMPKVRGSATEALADFVGAVDPVLRLLLEVAGAGGGSLWLRRYGEQGVEDVHELELGLKDPDTGGDRDAVAGLFGRLSDAMDAAYGHVSTPKVLRSFHQQRWNDAEDAGTASAVEPSLGGWGFEQAVQDVSWLNFFGPAFVARWGSRLDGAGVRQVETANGGRVVWACEDWRDLEPPGGPSDDWQGARITDPAPKQSFYDALGRDTFVHEQLQAGAPGERVPTVAEHQAATGRGALALDVPWRGSGTAAASGTRSSDDAAVADADPVVVELVGRLRSLGFLRSEVGADADVAARIDAEHRDQWGEQLDPADPLMPVVVLAADTGRVWWKDLEADVLPGGGVYEQVVPRWAALVGASVESVTEVWPEDNGDAGPMITVVVEGREVVLEATHRDDWIDLGVLAQLDAAIGTADCRVAVVEPFDQTAVVVAVADEQRGALAEVLGRGLLDPHAAAVVDP